MGRIIAGTKKVTMNKLLKLAQKFESESLRMAPEEYMPIKENLINFTQSAVKNILNVDENYLKDVYVKICECKHSLAEKNIDVRDINNFLRILLSLLSDIQKLKTAAKEVDNRANILYGYMLHDHKYRHGEYD